MLRCSSLISRKLFRRPGVDQYCFRPIAIQWSSVHSLGGDQAPIDFSDSNGPSEHSLDSQDSKATHSFEAPHLSPPILGYLKRKPTKSLDSEHLFSQVQVSGKGNVNQQQTKVLRKQGEVIPLRQHEAEPNQDEEWLRTMVQHMKAHQVDVHHISSVQLAEHASENQEGSSEEKLSGNLQSVNDERADNKQEPFSRNFRLWAAAAHVITDSSQSFTDMQKAQRRQRQVSTLLDNSYRADNVCSSSIRDAVDVYTLNKRMSMPDFRYTAFLQTQTISSQLKPYVASRALSMEEGSGIAGKLGISRAHSLQSPEEKPANTLSLYLLRKQKQRHRFASYSSPCYSKNSLYGSQQHEGQSSARFVSYFRPIDVPIKAKWPLIESGGQNPWQHSFLELPVGMMHPEYLLSTIDRRPDYRLPGQVMREGRKWAQAWQRGKFGSSFLGKAPDNCMKGRLSQYGVRDSFGCPAYSATVQEQLQRCRSSHVWCDDSIDMRPIASTLPSLHSDETCYNEARALLGDALDKLESCQKEKKQKKPIDFSHILSQVSVASHFGQEYAADACKIIGTDVSNMAVSEFMLMLYSLSEGNVSMGSTQEKSLELDSSSEILNPFWEFDGNFEFDDDMVTFSEPTFHEQPTSVDAITKPPVLSMTIQNQTDTNLEAQPALADPLAFEFSKAISIQVCNDVGQAVSKLQTMPMWQGNSAITLSNPKQLPSNIFATVNPNSVSDMSAEVGQASIRHAVVRSIGDKCHGAGLKAWSGNIQSDDLIADTPRNSRPTKYLNNDDEIRMHFASRADSFSRVFDYASLLPWESNTFGKPGWQPSLEDSKPSKRQKALQRSWEIQDTPAEHMSAFSCSAEEWARPCLLHNLCSPGDELAMQEILSKVDSILAPSASSVSAVAEAYHNSVGLSTNPLVANVPTHIYLPNATTMMRSMLARVAQKHTDLRLGGNSFCWQHTLAFMIREISSPTLESDAAHEMTRRHFESLIRRLVVQPIETLDPHSDWQPEIVGCKDFDKLARMKVAGIRPLKVRQAVTGRTISDLMQLGIISRALSKSIDADTGNHHTLPMASRLHEALQSVGRAQQLSHSLAQEITAHLPAPDRQRIVEELSSALQALDDFVQSHSEHFRYSAEQTADSNTDASRDNETNASNAATADDFPGIEMVRIQIKNILEGLEDLPLSIDDVTYQLMRDCLHFYGERVHNIMIHMAYSNAILSVSGNLSRQYKMPMREVRAVLEGKFACQAESPEDFEFVWALQDAWSRVKYHSEEQELSTTCFECRDETVKLIEQYLFSQECIDPSDIQQRSRFILEIAAPMSMRAVLSGSLGDEEKLHRLHGIFATLTSFIGLPSSSVLYAHLVAGCIEIGYGSQALSALALAGDSSLARGTLVNLGSIMACSVSEGDVQPGQTSSRTALRAFIAALKGFAAQSAPGDDLPSQHTSFSSMDSALASMVVDSSFQELLAAASREHGSTYFAEVGVDPKFPYTKSGDKTHESPEILLLQQTLQECGFEESAISLDVILCKLKLNQHETAEAVVTRALFSPNSSAGIVMACVHIMQEPENVLSGARLLARIRPGYCMGVHGSVLPKSSMPQVFKEIMEVSIGVDHQFEFGVPPFLVSTVKQLLVHKSLSIDVIAQGAMQFCDSNEEWCEVHQFVAEIGMEVAAERKSLDDVLAVIRWIPQAQYLKDLGMSSQKLGQLFPDEPVSSMEEVQELTEMESSESFCNILNPRLRCKYNERLAHLHFKALMACQDLDGALEIFVSGQPVSSQPILMEMAYSLFHYMADRRLGSDLLAMCESVMPNRGMIPEEWCWNIAVECLFSQECRKSNHVPNFSQAFKVLFGLMTGEMYSCRPDCTMLLQILDEVWESGHTHIALGIVQLMSRHAPLAWTRRARSSLLAKFVTSPPDADISLRKLKAIRNGSGSSQASINSTSDEFTVHLSSQSLGPRQYMQRDERFTRDVISGEMKKTQEEFFPLQATEDEFTMHIIREWKEWYGEEAEHIARDLLDNHSPQDDFQNVFGSRMDDFHSLLLKKMVQVMASNSNFLQIEHSATRKHENEKYISNARQVFQRVTDQTFRDLIISNSKSINPANMATIEQILKSSEVEKVRQDHQQLAEEMFGLEGSELDLMTDRLNGTLDAYLTQLYNDIKSEFERTFDSLESLVPEKTGDTSAGIELAKLLKEDIQGSSSPLTLALMQADEPILGIDNLTEAERQMAFEFSHEANDLQIQFESILEEKGWQEAIKLVPAGLRAMFEHFYRGDKSLRSMQPISEQDDTAQMGFEKVNYEEQEMAQLFIKKIQQARAIRVFNLLDDAGQKEGHLDQESLSAREEFLATLRQLPLYWRLFTGIRLPKTHNDDTELENMWTFPADVQPVVSSFGNTDPASDSTTIARNQQLDFLIQFAGVPFGSEIPCRSQDLEVLFTAAIQAGLMEKAKDVWRELCGSNVHAVTPSSSLPCLSMNASIAAVKFFLYHGNFDAACLVASGSTPITCPNGLHTALVSGLSDVSLQQHLSARPSDVGSATPSTAAVFEILHWLGSASMIQESAITKESLTSTAHLLIMTHHSPLEMSQQLLAYCIAHGFDISIVSKICVLQMSCAGQGLRACNILRWAVRNLDHVVTTAESLALLNGAIQCGDARQVFQISLQLIRSPQLPTPDEYTVQNILDFFHSNWCSDGCNTESDYLLYMKRLSSVASQELGFHSFSSWMKRVHRDAEGARMGDPTLQGQRMSIAMGMLERGAWRDEMLDEIPREGPIKYYHTMDDFERVVKEFEDAKQLEEQSGESTEQ